MSSPVTTSWGTESEVVEASGNVEKVARWGNRGFRGPGHCSPIVDDEVETPKTNGRSEGPNNTTVVVGHLEPGKFVKNTKAST
jgi:hypothetical protein